MTGAFLKLGRKVARTASKVSLVADGLANLGIAAVGSGIQGMVTGHRPPVVSWLRDHRPEHFGKLVGGAMHLFSERAEDSFGLSLDQMVEAEKGLMNMLLPGPDKEGRYQPPELLSKLADCSLQDNGVPRTSFVYLTRELSEQAQDISENWDLAVKDPELLAFNPYSEGSQSHHVFEVLKKKYSEGRFPVFVDLDGDLKGYSTAEQLMKEQVHSLVEKHNTFGDGFQDPQSYYRWFTTRASNYNERLKPYFAAHRPSVHKTLDAIKSDLNPPWTGGDAKGLGPAPSTKGIARAEATLHGMMEKAQNDAKAGDTRALCDFADTIVGLDQDISVGTETHWVRFLREIGSEKRADFLQGLASTWASLNFVESGDQNICSQHDLPMKSIEGDPPREVERQYDRAYAVGEAVDHVLDGLSPGERRTFLSQLKGELAKRKDDFEQRENQLRTRYRDYPGVPIRSLLLGSDYNQAEPAVSVLRQLSENSNTESYCEKSFVRRHVQMVDWIANADSRYGDTDPGVTFGAPCFHDQPLSIGQYFSTQLSQPKKGVTPVADRALEPTFLGEPGSPTKRLSVVLEGGGGKGQAYAAALKSTLQSLDREKGQSFEIDEFCGTSAGAITAGFLAAGFGADELSQTLSEMSPLKFNSDGLTLLGANNPLVGGLNRTGLFSMQKMYQELYSRLSEKLGVKGRPILFSDFPHSLKVVTTVASTNLPQEDPIRDLIDKDGRMVLSRHTTPHFDAVAAIISSAAVPGFFQSPVTEIPRKDPTTGEYRMHQIQFCDGGVIENLPVSTTEKAEKSLAVALPVRFRVEDPETGEVTAKLNTLDFSGEALEAVNAENVKLFEKNIPELAGFLKGTDVDRAVLAFALADTNELAKPALLGSDRELSRQLHSQQGEFQTLGESDSRSFFDGVQHKPKGPFDVTGLLFDKFLDGQREGDGNRLAAGDVRVDSDEIDRVSDTIGASIASSLASKGQFQVRRFEAGSGMDDLCLYNLVD